MEPLRVRSSSTTCDGALALNTACIATCESGRGISICSISQAARKREKPSRTVYGLGCVVWDRPHTSRHTPQTTLLEDNAHPQTWKHRELRDRATGGTVSRVLVEIEKHVLRVVGVHHTDVRRDHR